jgi:hypothetical protein
MDRNLLDQLLGLGEAGLTLGTGAVAGAAGMPYGLFKGITGGGYGTREGVQQAQREAQAFMERNTYQPRTEAGQGLLQSLGKAMEASKLPPVLPEAMLLASIPRAAAAAQAERLGMAAEKSLEAPLQRAYDKGGLSREMLLAMGQGTQSPVIRRVGEMGFDPRFDPRVNEQEKLRSLVTDVDEPRVQVPKASLVDFEGRPFLTSMSDRTGVGLLKSINDVELNRPVNMRGGQDYMFNNPFVWAAAKGPAKKLLKDAQIIKAETGQNPIYMPYRMAPTGGDFSSMTGESMLSFADASMTKKAQKKLDREIKKIIPDWAGVSDPDSIQQFRNASDINRKKLKNMLDVGFRDEGGLSIGQARLSVADPTQLNAQEGGLMNVGEIFADQPISGMSGHPDYPYGVPGQGIARLVEDVNIFQLLPNVVEARGIPDPLSPRAKDLRSLQMKPHAGVISEGLLRRLGF